MNAIFRAGSGAVLRTALAGLAIVLAAGGCSAGVREGRAEAAHGGVSEGHAQQQSALAGRVVGPAGEPVAGALVSASSHFDVHTRELQYRETRSDARGEFLFVSLPPGTYGVTATAGDGAAGYGGAFELPPRTGAVSAAAGPTSRGVIVRIGGPGVAFRGVVRDEGGSPLPATRLLAASFSQNIGEVYVAFSDAQGHYALQLPVQPRYMLVADAAPRPRAAQLLIGPPSQEVNFQLAAPPAPRPSDEAIAAWLRARATPLSIDAALDERAAKAIGDVVGDARVVALGETAHGTGDFTRLRLRVFQALVRDKGFRVYAVESSWADSLLIDDYVVDGKGDARSTLLAQYGRGEATEEMLELVEWMREYNRDPRHSDKLHFLGFDIASSRAASELLTYLRQVDPPAVATAQRTLDPLASASAHETFGALPDSQRQETLAALAALVSRFEANRSRYVSRSSNEAWLRGRAYARAIERMAVASRDEYVRDEQMFDTLRELVASFSASAGFLVSAHNAHIAAEAQIFYHMGVLARRHWGAGYVTIGTAFGEGSLYAKDYTQGPSDTVKIHRTARAPLGTLDGDLSLARLPAFVVDLRGAPGPIAAWLRSPQRHRYHGSLFLGDARSFEPVTPATAFDAIIYLDQISAHHPLARRDDTGGQEHALR